MKCKHNRIIKRVFVDSAKTDIKEQYREHYECAHCGIIFLVKPQCEGCDNE